MMRFLKQIFILLIFFLFFDYACGIRRFRRARTLHGQDAEEVYELKINDGDRKEFNVSRNEAIFSYQECKNKLLRLISTSRLRAEEKERISKEIRKMKNLIEKIINNARKIDEKNLNITEKSQLILFNKTIDMLNSFFTDSLKNIVEKYEKNCKKVEQSQEFFWIESIQEEYPDYPFLRSVEFSEKFNQLQKMHEKMDKYILLFFEWLNLYLKQDE